MSYRDYINEQKKYIQTKKEAREAREERLRNPRPPRLDPPPPKTNVLPIVLIGVAIFAFAAWGFLSLSTPAAVVDGPHSPVVWVQGTEQEFEQIRAWLEPEIGANNLTWTIGQVSGRHELVSHLLSGSPADLFLIDSELAQELYEAGVLVPLHQKQESVLFTSVYDPLWNPQPFGKTLGWAIPGGGDVNAARHLYTVMRQFGEPFYPFALNY